MISVSSTWTKQVAGDAAASFGVLVFAKATGDLLLDLAHSQVALGPVTHTIRETTQ